MKVFLCVTLLALSDFAYSQEAKAETVNVEVEAKDTDVGTEKVEERSIYGGGYGGGPGFGAGYGGGYGGGYGTGFNRFGSAAQASGFNQGSNQYAQNQQFKNVAGFKHTEGFREQQGFSKSEKNQYGSGFNTAAGGFQNQQGGFGQFGGAHGGGYAFGRR